MQIFTRFIINDKVLDNLANSFLFVFRVTVLYGKRLSKHTTFGLDWACQCRVFDHVATICFRDTQLYLHFSTILSPNVRGFFPTLSPPLFRRGKVHLVDTKLLKKVGRACCRQASSITQKCRKSSMYTTNRFVYVVTTTIR
jgi:hypothetical protein